MFGSTYNGQFEDVEAVDKMVGACLLLLIKCRHHGWLDFSCFVLTLRLVPRQHSLLYST